MRVLHVLAETGWSGGEEQLRIVVEHLQRAGHHNALLLAPGARFAELGGRLGLPVMEAPLRAPWRIGCWTEARAAVRAAAPDIVHFGCGRSLLWAGLATRGLRVPVRITTRRIDYPIGRWPWRAFRYRLLVDHVVANCESVRRQVLACGVPGTRVTVVHEGIELAPWQGVRARRGAARQRLGLPAAALVVCCPATLRPRKGQRVLVRAFARLAARFPQAVLVLAGEGGDRPALEALVAGLGLGDRVRLPGPVRPVADLYAASDLFCLASHHEGLANACLEASAAGLACVVSDAGGLPEIVADGETGAVVPRGDEAALAAALERFLADAPLRERAGAAGAVRTNARFSAEAAGRGMVRLLESLLAAAPTRPLD